MNIKNPEAKDDTFIADDLQLLVIDVYTQQNWYNLYSSKMMTSPNNFNNFYEVMISEIDYKLKFKQEQAHLQ